MKPMFTPLYLGGVQASRMLNASMCRMCSSSWSMLPCRLMLPMFGTEPSSHTSPQRYDAYRSPGPEMAAAVESTQNRRLPKIRMTVSPSGQAWPNCRFQIVSGVFGQKNGGLGSRTQKLGRALVSPHDVGRPPGGGLPTDARGPVCGQDGRSASCDAGE